MIGSAACQQECASTTMRRVTPSVAFAVARNGVPRGHKNPLWFGLPQRLLDARDLARLALRDLAARAEVANTSIAKIENRQSTPAIDTVERLAAALGLDPCWLAFGWDGAQPFAQRIRRLVDPERAPLPEPGPRPFQAMYLGLPQRLAHARDVRGLSMRGLARQAGLSVQTVSKTENGATVPIVSNLEALAVALEVSPCWLAFGIGEPPRPRD
ncbi:MAG: helix-turn-helix transcriptional regulator [Polyangia bacterium]